MGYIFLSLVDIEKPISVHSGCSILHSAANEQDWVLINSYLDLIVSVTLGKFNIEQNTEVKRGNDISKELFPPLSTALNC